MRRNFAQGTVLRLGRHARRSKSVVFVADGTRNTRVVSATLVWIRLCGAAIAAD